MRLSKRNMTLGFMPMKMQGFEIMSDMITDCNRDRKISDWCVHRIEPLLKSYFDCEITKDEIIANLVEIREEAPKYRGYFSSSAFDIVGKVIRDLKNDDVEWLKKKVDR